MPQTQRREHQSLLLYCISLIVTYPNSALLYLINSNLSISTLLYCSSKVGGIKQFYFEDGRTMVWPTRGGLAIKRDSNSSGEIGVRYTSRDFDCYRLLFSKNIFNDALKTAFGQHVRRFLG